MLAAFEGWPTAWQCILELERLCGGTQSWLSSHADITRRGAPRLVETLEERCFNKIPIKLAMLVGVFAYIYIYIHIIIYIDIQITIIYKYICWGICLIRGRPIQKLLENTALWKETLSIHSIPIFKETVQIQPRNQYSSYDSDRIFRPYPIDVGSGQERLEQMSQFLFVKRFRCGLLDKMSLTLWMWPSQLFFWSLGQQSPGVLVEVTIFPLKCSFIFLVFWTRLVLDGYEKYVANSCS